MMFDGSSDYTIGSDEVFIHASNVTTATNLHPRAVRFQNVEVNTDNSYNDQYGEYVLPPANKVAGK